MKKVLFTIIFLSGLSFVLFAGTVQGLVTDVFTNQPVENAKVHFTTNDGQHICFNAYTDANGFYSMDILNETYNGRAIKMKEYRVTLIESIEINDGITNVDFELIPTDGNRSEQRFGKSNLNPRK